jgi:hypothetical protein
VVRVVLNGFNLKAMKEHTKIIETLLRVKVGLSTNADMAINKSLANVHAKGLFSLVAEGAENGKLLRIFIADTKIRPFDIQLHSHRYSINLIPIKGCVKQHIATPGKIEMPMYKYHSFLNGGDGLKFQRTGKFNIQEMFIPKAAVLHMDEDEIHTISCTRGSMWIVEELGFKRDFSFVLGVPFIVEGLYTEPPMFQINDKAQLVLQEINGILKDFGF